jgi:hypothetical protein
MPQDRDTGARADKYGRETAQLIAKEIGAKPISSNSNEFAYQGRWVTIRCAHRRTADVGVSYSMLRRIDSIIAAFEDKAGEYDLYEMTPALIRTILRDSKGIGKVGLVRKSLFVGLGRFLTHVLLSRIPH